MAHVQVVVVLQLFDPLPLLGQINLSNRELASFPLPELPEGDSHGWRSSLTYFKRASLVALHTEDSLDLDQ